MVGQLINIAYTCVNIQMTCAILDAALSVGVLLTKAMCWFKYAGALYQTSLDRIHSSRARSTPPPSEGIRETPVDLVAH